MFRDFAVAFNFFGEPYDIQARMPTSDCRILVIMAYCNIYGRRTSDCPQ